MSRDQIQKDLIAIVGNEKVITDSLELEFYSYDSSFWTKLHNYVPDAVVLPTSTEEVSKIMAYCHKNKIPVTPRGAATGETAGCVPVNGGIVMDLSKWDTIEEVDVPNMQCFVRPGVIHAKLNARLAEDNLFFPPDPGSSRMATIGGLVANNSSGLRAVKYGSTENYVLGLEIVLANGDVITTGGQKSRSVKSVSGMNLTKLFVGSEGTIGIITKVRLRVWPKPKGRGICMAVFSKLEDAPATVLDVYRQGILPSGIEILDDSAIKAVNEYAPELNLPNAEAILLFEVDGNPASVEYEGQVIKEVASTRATQVEWATEPDRMAALWRGRSVTASAAARAREDGTRVFTGEDISVPLGRVTEALRNIKALGDKHGIKVVIYGHIGDGNVHTAPVIDPDNKAEVEQVHKLADAIHRLAVELGGSTTGEHGVGYVRSKYAELEHGAAVNTMREIKKTLDPNGIMNPAKLFRNEGEVSAD